MANITELIKNIRNAIFGKDVRESIAGAIEQCYEDGAKSGNANMEVADARGIYGTLKKRLDNSDNVKADKTELEAEISTRTNADSNLQNKINGVDSKLQSQINGLASGSPLVASSVSGMTNTSKVYVNTTDGHWYWYNGSSWVDGGVYQGTEVANNSIDINKLNDILKKVINSETPTYTENIGFITISGVIDNNSGYRYSSPIRLLKNQTIHLQAKGYSTLSMITECDKDGENRIVKIAGIDNKVRDYEYTAKYDTYIIVSYNNSYEMTCFINYYLTDYMNETNKKIENINFIISSKINSNIDISLINDMNKGLSNSGVYSAVSFHSCSDYILLEAGTKIAYRLRNATNNYLNVAIYDTDKQFVRGIKGEKNTYKTGIIELQNDGYVRFMTNFDVSDLFITTDKNIIELVKKLYDNVEKADTNNIFIESDNHKILSIFERLAVIGDSLSSGCIEGENGGDKYNYSWLSQIGRMCGNEIVHYSRGGETTKTWLNSSSYNKIATDEPCQAYFVALGTNDRGNDYTLGTTEDIGTDNDTFYANYFKILNRIKEVAPSAKIFICSLYGNSTTNAPEFNEAIKYFADNTENAYYIDITDTLAGKLSKYKVGGHFTAIGYKFVADEIINKCYQIIINNYTDFSNVGLY